MSWMAITIFILFAFIGVVFLFIACNSILHTRRFLEESTLGEGSVIGIETVRGNPRTTYSPRVRFMTTEGKQIEFVASVSSSKVEFSIGEKVPIRYKSSHPEEATIDKFMHVWMVSVVLLVLGLGFIIMSLLPFSMI
jgi:hypothetical protein